MAAKAASGVVAIERVQRRFEDALAEGPTVQVVAGPGWGKSTHAQSYVERSAGTVLYHSVQTRAPPPSTGADPAVTGEDRILAAMDRLLEGPSGEPRLLVLDDCQRLPEDGVAGQLIGELALSPPDDLRLLLLTRRHLGRWLSRVVAAGRCIILTEDDLRLTSEESEAILRSRGTVDDGRVTDVVRAMAGWPAGLGLAAQGRLDTADPCPETLTGFLDAELLPDLHPDEREFLTGASIVDDLTKAAVEELFGPAGLSVWERLRTKHLPMTTFAGDRLTLAPAFRSYLKNRLAADPERLREFHRAYADLQAKRGELQAAAATYLTIGAHGQAVHAIEAEFRAIGDVPERWAGARRLLDRLGDDVIAANPALSAARLRCLWREVNLEDGAAMIRSLEWEGRLAEVVRADPRVVAVIGWILHHRPAEASYYLDKYDGDHQTEPIRYMIAATSERRPAARPLGSDWGEFNRIIEWGLLWQGALQDVVDSALSRPDGITDNPALILAALWNDQRELATESWARTAPGRRGRPFAQFALAAMKSFDGDYEGAFEILEASLVAARDTGELRRFEVFAAWLMVRLGRTRHAVLLLQEKLDALAEAGQLALGELARMALGWAWLSIGDHDRALVDLDDALASMRAAGRGMLVPATVLLTAECLTRRGDPRAAELVLRSTDLNFEQQRRHFWAREALTACTELERSGVLERVATRVSFERAGPAAASRLTAPKVRIRPFGHEPMLVVDGTESVVGRVKLLELALFLAHEPVGVRRAELRQRLFPDVDLHRGGNHFRQVVFQLRKLTGVDLSHDNPSYISWPAGSVVSDDIEFEWLIDEARSAPAEETQEVLQQALQLANGPLLPASDLLWVEERRRYLELLFENAMGQFIRVAVAHRTGDRRTQEIRRACAQLLEINPYSTETYAFLIESEFFAGNRTEAMAAYRRAVAALGEIYLEPPESLRQLVQTYG